MLSQNRRQSDDTALDERLTSLLEAAAAPSEPGPLPGEAQALAAFRASHSATRRPSMLSSLTSAKAALAAALGAGLLLTGGAATAGVLPDAAQDTASNLLSKVGVTVPRADERSAGHAEDRGASEGAGSEREPDASDTGHSVADQARNSELTGVDKGAAVSELASGGKSHAGEHGGDDSSEAADQGDHEQGDHEQGGSPKAGDDADDADDAAEVHAEAAEHTGEESHGGEERADVEHADHDTDESAEKADELGDDHSAAGTTKRP